MKVKDILKLLDDTEQDIVSVSNIIGYHYTGHWRNNFDRRMLEQWGELEVLSIYGFNAEGYNGIHITVNDKHAI